MKQIVLLIFSLLIGFNTSIAKVTTIGGLKVDLQRTAADATNALECVDNSGTTVFTVIAASGNTDIAGTLTVDGAMTFTGAITASGAFTATSGAVTVSTTSVVGDLTVGGYNAGSLTKVQGLLVVSTSTFDGVATFAANITATAATSTFGTIVISSGTIAASTCTVNGDLTVQAGGVVKFPAGGTIGDVTLGNVTSSSITLTAYDITVQGGGELKVGGVSTLDTVNVSSYTATAELYIGTSPDACAGAFLGVLASPPSDAMMIGTMYIDSDDSYKLKISTSDANDSAGELGWEVVGGQS